MWDVLKNIEEIRPQHVYDNLNCEGEQRNEDDEDIGMEDDLEFETFQWQGANERGNAKHGQNYENSRYKKIDVVKDELIALTRHLVPEQKHVLTKVLNLCKRHVRARRTGMPVDPLCLVVHGGAGNTIKKILF